MIDKSYRITKLSRTPAYGLKKIIITCLHIDSESSYNIKPVQAFMLLFCKKFAKAVINGYITDEGLISFLKLINYDEEFYKENYDNLIDELYVLDNSQNAEITVKRLNDFEYELIFSKYLNIEIGDFSNLFDYYDQILGHNKYELNYIIEKRNNHDFFIIYLEDKSDNKLRPYIAYDIIDDINKLKFFKKNQIKNNYIKALIEETKPDSKYLEQLKLICDRINTDRNLVDTFTSIASLKDFYLRLLHEKKILLTEIRNKLLSIKLNYNKEEVKYILIQLKKTDFNNLEIVKFLLTELEYNSKLLIIDEDRYKLPQQQRPKSSFVKTNALDLKVLKATTKIKK